MSKLEPMILRIVYDKKIISKETLVELVSSESLVEKGKIEKRIQKLLDQNKLYWFEDGVISILDFGNKLEEGINEKLKQIISKDFIFKNPLLDNGKEFCDNLIFFDGALIIIQAKTAKYKSDNPDSSDPLKLNNENFRNFAKKTFDEGSKQLKVSINRAKRTDFDLEVKNEKGKLVRIRYQNIKKIHAIVVVYYALDKKNFIIKSKSGSDHHFENLEVPRHILTYDELSMITSYFSTISDLIDYLDKRGKFVCEEKIHFVPAQEEDIIGLYYSSNRIMRPDDMSDEEYQKIDAVYYVGFAEDLGSGKLKKRLDKKTQLEKSRKYVDQIIERISNSDNKKSIEPLKELERLNSFERRLLGEGIELRIKEFIKSKKKFGLRSFPIKNCVFVFCISRLDIEETGNLLINACATAKAKLNLRRALGVFMVDRKPEGPYGITYDDKRYSEEEKRTLLRHCSKLWGEPQKKHVEEFK